MKDYAFLLEDLVFILLITYIFKNAVRICPLYLSAFIYLQKIDAIDLVALATQHTSTLF